MDTRLDPSYSGSAKPAHPRDSTVRPVRLRTVDTHQAPLARRVGAGLIAELSTGNGSLRLEVNGLQPAGAEGGTPPLRLLTRAGPLALSPARELLRALTAIDLPDDTPDDPLHGLRRDVTMQSLPPAWFSTFGASAALCMEGETVSPGEAPEADGFIDDAPGEMLELAFSITEPQARLGLAGTLRGSHEALLHALSQPAWQRVDPAPEIALEDLPLRVPVRLGTTALSLGAVRALGPGDVVPLAQPLFGLGGEGELRVGQAVAKVVLRLGNQCAVELTEWQPTTTGQTTMNDRLDFPYDTGIDAGTGADTDASLDELPVVLSFDIGTLEVTLAELQSMQLGSVLPLRGTLPPEVAICVGGRRLGTGELVELDGQLAVEVRRIGAMP